MQTLPARIDYFMQQMAEDSLLSLANRYFTEDLAGRSHLTLAARKSDLEKFFGFYEQLNGHLMAKDLMPRDTKLFAGYLHSKSYAPNTINRIIGSVRAFGTWLLENGFVRVHPCKGIRDLKVDLGPPKAPRDREYHRLLKTAQALADSERTSLSQNFRDLVIIETLNATGLRITEVLSLRLNQFHERKFHNVYCKGGKVRGVSIKSRVCELIDDYISNHRTGGSDYLFTSKSGRALDRVSAWKALKRIARITSANFPKEEAIELTPHRLRHRHAYQCRAIKDPVFAAARLGHSSLSYIHRYSQESHQEVRDLIESIE